MFICHEEKFIFFHLYKVAGCSITTALCNYPGLSTLYKRDDHIQPAHFKDREFDGRQGSQMLEDYFTFAFVRNPWDWQVSLFSYMVKHSHPDMVANPELKNFDKYLEWMADRKSEQYRFLSDDGSLETPISLDFVGRFEHLQSDFNKICDIVGLESARCPIQHLNHNAHDHYTNCYDDKTKKLVEDIFKADIDRFKYNFEGAMTSGAEEYENNQKTA